MRSPKIVAQILLSLLLISCNNNDVAPINKLDEKMNEQTPPAINAKKPETVVTVNFLKDLFGVPKEIGIDPNVIEGKCYYTWVDQNVSYDLTLQFYEFDDSKEKAESFFNDFTKPERFLNQEDKPFDIQSRSDRAVFSAIDGGQIIALKENTVIILHINLVDLISFNQIGKTDSSKREDMIQKGGKIIDESIDKLML